MHFDTKGLGHVLQPRQACRPLVGRLITLNLLLLQVQAIAQLLLTETRGNPRLDQRRRQFLEGIGLQDATAAGPQRFIFADLTLDVLKLTAQCYATAEFERRLGPPPDAMSGPCSAGGD